MMDLKQFHERPPRPWVSSTPDGDVKAELPSTEYESYLAVTVDPRTGDLTHCNFNPSKARNEDAFRLLVRAARHMVRM